MHPNAQLIERFYRSFQQRDALGMAACYAPDVHFADEVFPQLRGDRARGMWAMLCARAQDLSVEVSAVQADEHRGSAHWDARYTFAATGRKVLNRIDATFELEGGLIKRHRDAFDFYAWARQALGPVGLLLGWTPMLRARVQRTAAQSLDRFLAR